MKLITISLLTSVCALGCDNTAQGIRDDAEQAITTAVHQARTAGQELEYAKRSLDNDVNLFITKTNTELDGLSVKLERLRREAAKAPANAQQALSEQAAVLETRKHALETKIDEFSGKASDEWSNAKTEMSDAVATLGRDIDHALDELGNSARNATN